MKEMYRRDITILIVLATVVCMIVHYSSLFQFLSIYQVPTLVENSKKFCILNFNPFLQIIVDCLVNQRMPHQRCNCLKVKYPLRICQLCSSRYTAEQTKNCTKSTSVTKAATMKNMNGAGRPRYRHQLSSESEGSIKLLCQLDTCQYESRPS